MTCFQGDINGELITVLDDANIKPVNVISFYEKKGMKMRLVKVTNFTSHLLAFEFEGGENQRGCPSVL